MTMTTLELVLRSKPVYGNAPSLHLFVGFIYFILLSKIQGRRLSLVMTTMLMSPQ